MSILVLSFIGGIISAVSTSIGSLLAPLFSKFETLRKYHMSMDFALGVMLSAVAFSLVGPELVKGHSIGMIFGGLLAGGLFILLTHKMISYFNREQKFNSYKTLLVAALIFHNLPEGMGAGASLAGMSLNEAIPLQVAISIQNVAEGLLLTMLLQGLGLSLTWSVLGGIISGLIEMSGAIAAGFLLQETTTLLPFLLSLAGGAMMMSVLLEMHESLSLGKYPKFKDFLGGMLVIPLTNFLMG